MNNQEEDFGVSDAQRTWDVYREWSVADLYAARDLLTEELERLEQSRRDAGAAYALILASGEDDSPGMRSGQRASLSALKKVMETNARRTVVHEILIRKIQRPEEKVLRVEDLGEDEQQDIASKIQQARTIYRPYDDETRLDEAPTKNGRPLWRADAIWAPIGRRIVNIYHEIYPDIADTQAKAALHMRPILRDEFDVDTSTFGVDQLRDILERHRNEALE